MVRTNPKYLNQAWVLGMFESGLTAVRSLGRLGIPVFGIDWNPNMPGCYSRFGHFRSTPSPVESAGELLEWFLLEGKKLAEPAVLIPATDAYVAFISRYRVELSAYFRFALPSMPVTSALLDKLLFARLAQESGELTPQTVLVDGSTDLENMAAKIRYPALIKARQTHLWKTRFSEKGFEAGSPEELLQIARQVVNARVDAVVQEIIPAPPLEHVEVNFYRSAQPGRKILAILPVRKVRQYPSLLGSGSMVETWDNPVVVERTLKFAEQIDFQGIGNIEYIFDARTNDYYLVELNARLWQQNVQADHCGMNFPLICYADLLGLPERPVPPFHKGIKWLDPISDFQAFWEANRSGRLSLRKWLGSLHGTQVLATFAWDDWRPFLHDYQYGWKLLKFPLYLFRNRRRG
jgi:D-aspartate ligase